MFVFAMLLVWLIFFKTRVFSLSSICISIPLKFDGYVTLFLVRNQSKSWLKSWRMESSKKEWSHLGVSAGCRVWPVASGHGATDPLQLRRSVCLLNLWHSWAFVFAVSLWHPALAPDHPSSCGLHWCMWLCGLRGLGFLQGFIIVPMRQRIIRH